MVNEGLVRQQLAQGADSHVGTPGTNLTQGHNWISEGARADNANAKIADALASFTKAGHVAGPLFDRDWSKYKINSILAVKKPNGDIRIVSNLKLPKGQSFNEGISQDRLS